MQNVALKHFYLLVDAVVVAWPKRAKTLKGCNGQSFTAACAVFKVNVRKFRLYASNKLTVALKPIGKCASCTVIAHFGVEVEFDKLYVVFANVFCKLFKDVVACFHVVADSLWSIKVKNYFQSAVDKTVEIELGVMSRGLNYVLEPDEELTLPTVLFYEFRNKTDMDCYKLHRYLNDIYPAQSLPIVYNTWMGLFDVLDFDRVVEQLLRAKALGAEYFVIDAGWFGPPRAGAEVLEIGRNPINPALAAE